MQPKSKSDQFKPKWRHFHPQATVWLQNPFDEDIVFQVADEFNNASQYRLPANKVAELPGGMIATLGVKEVVDRLIMNNKEEALRIWDLPLRAKHEANVILRVKEPPVQSASRNAEGVIDLASKSEDLEQDLPDIAQPSQVSQVQEDDTPFPELTQKHRSAVDDIAAASLAGKQTQVIDED